MLKDTNSKLEWEEQVARPKKKIPKSYNSQYST